MKFLLLTPGTGYFYCGSCLREDQLAQALRGLGHDVTVVPLYLPLMLEHPSGEAPVHMGGINMYLQQKTRLARLLPRPLANLFDNPTLLRWASRRGKLTASTSLGAMTVSMLQGENGHQRKELDKLVAWARTAEKPDVIVLANVMLCGIVHELARALGRPVVCTLQGEAPFLDALPEPYAERAWRELVERTAEIDAFVPVSHSYGELMRARLGLEASRLHVVHNGIDLNGFEIEPQPLAEREPKTIGYLARMCHDKGITTLVDAFIALKKRSSIERLRLRIAGAMLGEDRALVSGLKERLRSAGYEADVDFLPNINRAAKLAFLETLSVLSVPATYGESFGLYLLEGLAAGVPAVQPRHAAFPEIIEATGGGILCEPDDPSSLADGLESLLSDQEWAQELATTGRRAVFDGFTSERMAREFGAVCRATVQARGMG